MSEQEFTFVPVDRVNVRYVPTIFQTVYEDKYLYKEVYQPSVLIEMIESGQMLAILAFDVNGRAAGYVALVSQSANPHLWELKSLVIDPEYHFTNLATRLALYFMEPMTYRSIPLKTMFVQAVCHHYFTQVLCTKAGLIDCAIGIDQTALSTYSSDRHNHERGAVVATFRDLSEITNVVYAPPPYAEILRWLLQPIKPRQFYTATALLSIDQNTIKESEYYPDSQLWQMEVWMSGNDWPVVLADFLDKAAADGTVCVQVILNLACQSVGAAVQVLRNFGFYLGGVLPCWFGADGLLMQQTLGQEPEFDNIKLYSKRAKQLFIAIRSDWEEVQRLTQG